MSLGWTAGIVVLLVMNIVCAIQVYRHLVKCQDLRRAQLDELNSILKKFSDRLENR